MLRSIDTFKKSIAKPRSPRDLAKKVHGDGNPQCAGG